LGGGGPTSWVKVVFVLGKRELKIGDNNSSIAVLGFEGRGGKRSFRQIEAIPEKEKSERNTTIKGEATRGVIGGVDLQGENEEEGALYGGPII